jgi:copper chaperone CopZ
MKFNSRIAIILLFSLIGFSVQAQEQNKKVVTDTVIVYGNCGMCKSRIEAALDTKGVKSAEWNIQTKQLIVSYVPIKISLTQILELVAGAGHDSDVKKSEESVYKTLPGCCLYRENPNTHTD